MMVKIGRSDKNQLFSADLYQNTTRLVEVIFRSQIRSFRRKVFEAVVKKRRHDGEHRPILSKRNQQFLADLHQNATR